MANDAPDLRDDLRVVMPVEAYDETVRFYRDVLDLPVLTSWEAAEDDPPGTLLRAGGGTVEIVGARPDRPAAGPQGFQLMLRTTDPDESLDRLRAAGAEIVREVHDTPWGYREFVVSDPNGVRITFYTVVDETVAGHL